MQIGKATFFHSRLEGSEDVIGFVAENEEIGCDFKREREMTINNIENFDLKCIQNLTRSP